MDWERLLVSTAAQRGKVDKLILEGIKESHFYDETLRDIYSFMVNHYREYGRPPSFHTVREEYPNHNFEITDESLDFIKDRFIKQTKRRYAIDAIRDLAKSVDDEDVIGDIDSLFLEKSRGLSQIVPSAIVSRLSDLDKRITRYSNRENSMQGIKMGIPDFDNISLGIQRHEYVSILGPSGLGKSTLATWILMNAYLQNKTSMIFSLEMESEALFRKWDTMLTKSISYMDLKSCEIDDNQKQELIEKAEKLKSKEQECDILVMDDVRNINPDRVYAELVRYKPDICCIDYIQLMAGVNSSSSQMWEKVTQVTNQLKQISRSLKIPIIGVAQSNRSSFSTGAQLDNVAGSISVIQDSDIVLGLFQDDDMKKEKQMQVRLLKNRDGATSSAEIYWDLENMIFEPWNAAHQFVSLQSNN